MLRATHFIAFCRICGVAVASHKSRFMSSETGLKTFLTALKFIGWSSPQVYLTSLHRSRILHSLFSATYSLLTLTLSFPRKILPMLSKLIFAVPHVMTNALFSIKPMSSRDLMCWERGFSNILYFPALPLYPILIKERRNAYGVVRMVEYGRIVLSSSLCASWSIVATSAY